MKTYYLITLFIALVLGGAIIAGLANAVGKADEKVPIADAWVVIGPQIHVEIKNGQVLLRRQVNVDAAGQTAENIAHGLDGGKSGRDNPEEWPCLHGKPLITVKPRWSLTTKIEPDCPPVHLAAKKRPKRRPSLSSSGA